MSHELRTPLNAIIGYTTLLQEDAIALDRSGEAADFERVLQASRNLLELINDILDLSRIEAGKTAFPRHIVDLRSFDAAVISFLHIGQPGTRKRHVPEVTSTTALLIAA